MSWVRERTRSKASVASSVSPTSSAMGLSVPSASTPAHHHQQQQDSNFNLNPSDTSAENSTTRDASQHIPAAAFREAQTRRSRAASPAFDTAPAPGRQQLLSPVAT
ncbi:hypothetical protein CONPUDRAFT_148024 [Coniophora puteana RWD-64-598 SS2]|uniref:Uncharacterized protein n=1 Tax=Coniophora puteana (strain RWD-64-598) TaxID=741705 RepID=A0A5M3N3A4_CONPW|nr:uncharacterized protein CONPUDRAFT_148024 [Coniophora puteana RWD-64-598 SS2]EIW85889.1 hypothetical protein CONPUDRAFT_148024 [Coniophora puteana RWD-64-598 SS2]